MDTHKGEGGKGDFFSFVSFFFSLFYLKKKYLFNFVLFNLILIFVWLYFLSLLPPVRLCMQRGSPRSHEPAESNRQRSFNID